MEDASKEFQIFMSPARDYQKPYREVTASKHRIVPVINKILSTSSTFTLNQRKCSVYKAVSGVSFQDTDVVEKKAVTRKRDKKKERRQSYVAPVMDSEKAYLMLPPAPGTRRSRSLTSMESAMTISTENNKNLPEITHPFTPVIISNQSSGRKSRYSRMRDRKRSSSQVRNTELKKQESSSQKTEQPVRPRRARSASRSRRPLSLISFENEIILDSSSQNKESLPLRCEKQPAQQVNSIYYKTVHSDAKDIISLIGSRRSNESEDIDFSVNDNDWRKYDVMVTEKLDLLLKKKEEPEGGYFSLEREESEEIEPFIEGGDHFQRDNSSESIYIAQTIAKENKICDIPVRYDQYTVEEVYSEVPFSNQGQEVGFVDDEGLYEEIFFNKGSEQGPTIFNNIHYGESSKINILVSPNIQSSHSMPKSAGESKSSKIEKSASSTIVYIRGEDSSHENDFENLLQASRPLKQSISCTNLLHRTSDSDKQNKEKRLSVVDIVNNPAKFEAKSSIWCGCYSKTNFQSSHTSSCIRSRPGLISSKYSQFGDKIDCEISNSINVKPLSEIYVPRNVNDKVTTDSVHSSTSCLPSNNISTEPDYELSDIDLDMFTPKPLSDSPRALYENHMIRSLSEARLNLPISPLSFSNFSKSLKDGLPAATDIHFPKTFRGFLEDSIFNPPDTDSATDDNEELFIDEDQIVTCITDTDSSSISSSSEEDDDASPVTSPWLEAKNEFEFLTFKDDKRKPLRFFKRKKPKKESSSARIFGSSLLPETFKDIYTRSNSAESNPIPKRPNRRRRKTSDTNKLGDIN